jgi:hypothetical protein
MAAFWGKAVKDPDRRSRRREWRVPQRHISYLSIAAPDGRHLVDVNIEIRKFRGTTACHW